MAENYDQDIQELRDKYLNQDFDETQFELDAAAAVDYARYCGETASRFLDEKDDDFQAAPTFIASKSGGRTVPLDFPRLGIGMDAGKRVECFKPIRPPVTLTGRTHLHDIYTKTGRSGRMVFLVSRVEFYDPDGDHVANSDTRIVMREKS